MSNDKEAALLIHLEVEQACKKQGLPFVLIIGLPDTEAGSVRSSYGLIHEQANRDFMTAQFLDYMHKISQPGFKPKDR